MKFRRQHPIGPYICDFYARDAGLVVEVDGSSHSSSDRYMHGLGLRVLRIPASDVGTDPHAVAQMIAVAARERVLPDHPSRQWRYAGELRQGAVLFAGLATAPARVSRIENAQVDERACRIEVAGAHSVMTSTCAVHDCSTEFG